MKEISIFKVKDLLKPSTKIINAMQEAKQKVGRGSNGFVIRRGGGKYQVTFSMKEAKFNVEKVSPKHAVRSFFSHGLIHGHISSR
ncbi:MAG: hypothetical protein GY710_24160, partial [Desulfobacteraceae bacterium]|nr:hypothetical protein [Desulfobacteraceae bacterium]